MIERRVGNSLLAEHLPDFRGIVDIERGFFDYAICNCILMAMLERYSIPADFRPGPYSRQLIQGKASVLFSDDEESGLKRQVAQYTFFSDKKQNKAYKILIPLVEVDDFVIEGVHLTKNINPCSRVDPDTLPWFGISKTSIRLSELFPGIVEV